MAQAPPKFYYQSVSTGFQDSAPAFQLRLRTTYVPTGSTDTNGNVGDICWGISGSSTFMFVKCDDDKWRRTNAFTGGTW